MKFYFVSYCQFFITGFVFDKPPVCLFQSAVTTNHPFEYIANAKKTANIVLLNWKEITEQEYYLYRIVFHEPDVRQGSFKQTELNPDNR